MKKHNTLVLMPYLPLEGLIKFDGLQIWSYQKLGNTLIKNTALKNHIDKLVGCYQLHKGNKIQNPAIVSGSKICFTNPTQLTISKIEVLKNILLFLGILENNSWSFITSDNFEVFYQRFVVGDSGLATQAGAIHHITSGGYSIDEMIFLKPECINLPLRFNPNGPIFRALEDCMVQSRSSQDKSQIIQSLNPLFNAYRNSHEHSWQSRILLIVMAFELLFGETERKNFRKNIQKYSTLGLNKLSKTYKYPIMDTRNGKVIGYEDLTLNQIWAEEFYKLRHKIIHGDTIYSDDSIFTDLVVNKVPKEPHFYIAINFFVVCLLNNLRELGYQNIEHYVINSDSSKVIFNKVISGIKDELFKIEDIGLYDAISNNIPDEQ
ncbi:MAG: hypothetical protein WC851_00275 [Candidatus Shapirobacteria bacterium]|jgi:hypothetical protein